MPAYRIVCVTLGRHGHVIDIGTGNDPGSRRQSWPVREVFRALVAGDSFYTLSPSTGARAGIEVEQCAVDGCHELTIRSTPEAVSDNTIESLGACNWI